MTRVWILGWIALCTVHFSACAQRTFPVRNLEVSVPLGENLSLRQAKAKGEQELKLEALRRAGVGENISAYQSLMNFEDGESLDQLFTSDIQTDLQGTVSRLEITDSRNRLNEFGGFEIWLRGNAEVIRNKGDSDPNFQVTVDGIRNQYRSGQALEFNLVSSRPGHVQVFLIGEDNQASRLFPNAYERDVRLEAQQNYRFPLQSVAYTLSTRKPDHEYYRVVILMTKSPVALPVTENRDDPGAATRMDASQLMRWLYQLPADQRRFYFQAIKLDAT